LKKERKEESFLKKPWYKGGQYAMAEFIAEHLKYPVEARENKVQGKVRLKLSIDYLGSVIDARVQSGLGYGCDEEAKRVAALLKFEVTKTPRKLKVTFHRNINISFQLNENRKEARPHPIHQRNQQFVYNIVASKKSKENKEEHNAQSTTVYNIKLNF
jgi:TonB family protein